MAVNSTEVAYAFGQMGSIHVRGTSAVTLIGGRDSDSTPASNVNRTDKVFVAITFLEDCTFTTLTPDSSDYIGTASGNGDAIDTSNTFPQGVTIFGRWNAFQLASGSVIAYLG